MAIVRELLIVGWHVLTKAVADRNGGPEQLACSFLVYTYKVAEPAPS